MKKIDISTPRYPNTYTLVDDEDYEYLSKWNWSVSRHHSGSLYTTARNGNRRISMHRLIVNAPENKMIDHKDRNPLNNQKENLRICSHAENKRNQNTYKNNKAGYKGVNWMPINKLWRARICVDNKLMHIGTYKNIIDAILAYNKAAIKYHKEFAKLNDLSTIFDGT